jgi:hypothetical protein
MSNQPVAWTTDPLNTDEWGDTDWQITVTKEKWSDKQIPLYIHPAKAQADIEYEADKAYWRNRTLTDEEIEQVRITIMSTAYWCADENMPEAYNAVKVCCGQVLSILKKAKK